MTLDPKHYVDGILSRDKRLLAKTITLVESSLAEHQEIARQVIDRILPHTGKAVRLGITGVPGAGKSTWVKHAVAGGAMPISDDVVLLDTSGPNAELMGSPFRVRDFGPPGPGRWPLAAILLSRHGDAPSLKPVPPALVRIRLASNFPWV